MPGVFKFQQTDWTSEAQTLAGAQAHMGKLESSLAALKQVLGQFAPYASSPPDMKVNVSGGTIADGLKTIANQANGITNNNLAALLPSASWESVAYGNGMFVAISYDSVTYATSTDGVNWTSRSFGSGTPNCRDITFGNGRFVMICDGGSPYPSSSAYSTDGINWTWRDLPGSAQNWISVVYGGGKFVAISTYNHVAYSTDGNSWTAATLPTAAGWAAITYGDGKYIAIAGDAFNNCVSVSTDAANWTNYSLPVSQSWVDIAYGNNVFVAISNDSGNVVIVSEDGFSWTQHSLPSSRVWKRICFGENSFVAVSDKGGGGMFDFVYVAQSVDGKFWGNEKGVALPDSSALTKGVAYGVGAFVVVFGGNAVSTTYVVIVGNEAEDLQISPFLVSDQVTSSLVAPVNNPRIDRIGIDVLSGGLLILTGTEAASPVPPSYQNDVLPICQVRLEPGQTVITNGHITDERGLTNADSPQAFVVKSGYSTELIPSMTSNTAPSGIASANSEYSASFQAWKAMDADSLTSRWQSAAGTVGWLAYEFTTAKTVTCYWLRADGANPANAPKDWTFEGWTGSQWDVLHTVINAPTFASGELRFYDINNATAYIKYRINITSNGGGSNYLIVGGFGMRQAASLSKTNAIYDDFASYALLTTPGSYRIDPPPQARYWRITAVGGSGGQGGSYYNSSGVLTAGGGGKGPGACLPNLMWAAESLIINVGANGVNGSNSTWGVNNATAGAAGEATVITGATSGVNAFIPGGGGGGPGLSTPAGGAAGSVGAAPAAPFNVGFAGTIGTAGTTGSPGSVGISGTCGELGQLGFSDSFVLLEWC